MIRPIVLSCAAIAVLVFAPAHQLSAQNPNPVPGDPSQWKQHAMDRPAPVAVTPAPYAGLVAAPSDAIVLFDGTSLAAWRAADTSKGDATWKIDNGALLAVAGAGDIATRRGFGSAQWHIEWMAPDPPHGEGQDRGNSGVFLMSTYEIQVLDSYRAATYPDGQAASVYGQFPPLVNASRAPGQWQTYDIVFHRPHFDATGKVTSPARVTLFHNGVLVQDNRAILGPTTNGHRTAYTAHADRMPLQLQDHGHPVRYRNIWVRELADDGN